MNSQLPSKEDGDRIFEELRNSIPRLHHSVAIKALPPDRPFYSAQENDVLLVGKAKASALKKGLPDDDNEAMSNCTYLAQYYASLRAQRGKPDWTQRYINFMNISGWPICRKSAVTHTDRVGSASTSSVTFKLIHDLGYLDMAEFMALQLKKMEGDSDAIKTMFASAKEKTTSFQLLPVEKPTGRETALVITHFELQTGSQGFWDYVSKLSDIFTGEDSSLKINGTASSHVLDETLYQVRLPTINQCLEEIATSGYSDVAENFNRSVR